MALQIGQGADMYWTYHSITPTEEEYLQTVDSSKLFSLIDLATMIVYRLVLYVLTMIFPETTALFRMASRLLQGQATMNR